MAANKRFRMTRQRKIILEELRNLHTHPTADEVYDAVRKRMPRISLGTVYRNLEILSQWGLAQRLDLAGTRRRFDGSTGDHYHVRCVRCGEVEDVPIEPLRNLEESVRGNTDFEIIGHRLNFLGLCPVCRNEASDPPAEPMRDEPQDLANEEQG
ncbi:MAG: Fur family transcriptional regulator [Thermodesulfobacteriota bacterium]